MRRLGYLVTGAQALLLPPFACLLGLGLALASAACGPIEYLSQVSDRAARAVAAAKQANADELAPYELTAATEYLHEAREQAGSAEYESAIEYGRRAEDLAIRARVIAEEKALARARARASEGADGGAGPRPAAGAGDPG